MCTSQNSLDCNSTSRPLPNLLLSTNSYFCLTAAPAGRFVKDDGTRPIKDGTLMDVEEDMEQVRTEWDLKLQKYPDDMEWKGSD